MRVNRSYYLVYGKQLIDIFVSFFAFLAFSPLFYFIIMCIKLDSKGPAFFKQKRIGQHFRPFQLVKFRSMTFSKNKSQGEFDPGDMGRVTRVGSFLRKTKLDELPELFNVLNRDMSLVGPRPEVQKYLRNYPEDFKEILQVRPGLSDYASIKYRNEEAMLASQTDPERHYLDVILPDKMRLSKRYLEEASFRTDLRIMKETIRSIVYVR